MLYHSASVQICCLDLSFRTEALDFMCSNYGFFETENSMLLHFSANKGWDVGFLQLVSELLVQPTVQQGSSAKAPRDSAVARLAEVVERKRSAGGGLDNLPSLSSRCFFSRRPCRSCTQRAARCVLWPARRLAHFQKCTFHG